MIDFTKDPTDPVAPIEHYAAECQTGFVYALVNVGLRLVALVVACAALPAICCRCTPTETTPYWPEHTMSETMADAKDKTYGGDVVEYFGLGWPSQFVMEKH